MRVRGHKFLLVTAGLLLLLYSCPCSAQDNKPDSLWIETSQALAADNASEARRLLRLCVLGQLNLPESEKLLHGLLASEAAVILSDQSLKDLKPDHLAEIFKLRREICTLGTAGAADWLNLLKAGAAVPGSENLIISGQAFLDAVQKGLPVIITDEWLELLQRLEREMVRDEQVLYRRQIVQIFASLEPASKELQNRLADIELLAEAKAIKILGLAEVEMALGNLDAARARLDQVRAFNSKYSGLTELYQRLDKAVRIDKILVQANDALLSKKYDEAGRRAEDILKIDANNFFARRIVEQIEEARKRPVSGGASAEDRLKLKLRRIEADLRKAEKEQDLQQVYIYLREILLLKSDLPEYSQRLAEVEQEIAVSRLKADEKFSEAEEMFKKAEYDRLRLFLNRNPGLMNSVEKMLQIWEMRLMANLFTGHLEAPQLREAAEMINRRAGRSFYASYVLMRLAIADNRLAEARGHYNIALELKPGAASLRWPGMLLWVHGEGRPVAVILLIVAFLLMIKLIRPFFSWFESTYWWRVAILASVFPSLAIRSLEGCFGTVKDRGERITLFTLLMKSCYRVGNSSKAMLYSDNLLELFPGNAAALEIRAKLKARSVAAAKAEVKKNADAPEEGQVIESGLSRDALPEATEDGAADEYHADAADDQCYAEYLAGDVADNECEGAEGNTLPYLPEQAKIESETVSSLAIPEEDEEDAGARGKAASDAVGDAAAGLFKDFFPEPETQPLRNQPAESKIEQKRSELFAELDSVQVPQPASDAWLEYCNGDIKVGRWFKELDQGR